MKNLNFIFNLLLFPFLLLLKGNRDAKQEYLAKLETRKLHYQFSTYIIPVLFLILLVTSPLSAVTTGGVDCSNSVTVDANTTSGRLDAGTAHTDDYFKFITGGPGEVLIHFNSDERIQFYAGTTGCPISDYFIDTRDTQGLGIITLDTNTTIYIHAERINKNTNYDFTIDFTPTPTKPALPQNICYDYAYEQLTIPFTEENNGSKNPHITGNPTIKTITVEIYVQNLDPVNEIKDLAFNVFDIDTNQAAYISDTTDILMPRALTTTHYSDINASPTGSYNNDIVIGDVDSREFFRVYYDIDPMNSNIDIPLNISVDYNITYNYGLISKVDYQYEIILDSSIPLCNSGNINYTPAYGIFNMEDSALTYSNKYNLPTQTANRVGDFVVAAYKANEVYNRIAVYTPVAVELIDAGKYGGTATSCGELDSTLGPRIWVIMGDETDPYNPIPANRADFNRATITAAIAGRQVSDQISGPTNAPIQTLNNAEDLFSYVRENTAFRLSYNGAGHGDLIDLDPVLCHKNSTEICYNVLNFTEIIKYNGGNCIQDVDGRPNNIDKIPQFCNNAGTAAASAMTKEQLAVCMECIYGFDINYLCSRDNFAIRPESYRINLNDQDQNDITQQSTIALNDNLGINQNRNYTNNTPYHVVAGYNYALTINAANHQNDNPTPGYKLGFFEDGNESNRSFRLSRWPKIGIDTVLDNACNDNEDHNKTVSFFSGGADLNLSNDEIGKYNLTLIDRLWTRVDWDPAYMTHHTTGQGAGYFLTGSDCVQGTSIVPQQGALTGNDGTNLINVSGCDITSDNHVNSDTGTKYKDIALRVHPYKFNVTGLTIGSRPTNDGSDNTFIYINTLDETLYPNKIDENMSYNIQKRFYAAGYTDNIVSNFVDQCYAEDVNMILKHTYLSDIPTTTANLTFDLLDYNTTNPSITYPSGDADTDRNQSTFTETLVKDANTDLTITQAENVFDKTMEGAITMDLGYNFKRENNLTLNPRRINFSDFNITYVTQPADTANLYADLKTDHKIFGNVDINKNVTFLYGKAKPGQFFYDDVRANSILTPVSVVVYCDLGTKNCQDRGLPLMGAQTNESYWWKSVSHNNVTEKDGNIALSIPTTGSFTSGTVQTMTANIDTLGTDNTIAVFYKNGGLPITIPIDLIVNDPTNPPAPPNYTDRWLIYNPYSATLAPSPFYKVRFIGNAVWTGVGETGHVVDTGISTKKTKRLDW